MNRDIRELLLPPSRQLEFNGFLARALWIDKREKDGTVGFQSNNAGGLLGGISNGDEIVVRLAIKPTPTISVVQDAINMAKGKVEKLEPITRRDPTLLGRIYSVVEAMAAVTLVDALMMARGYDSVCPPNNPWRDFQTKK